MCIDRTYVITLLVPPLTPLPSYFLFYMHSFKWPMISIRADYRSTDKGLFTGPWKTCQWLQYWGKCLSFFHQPILHRNPQRVVGLWVRLLHNAKTLRCTILCRQSCSLRPRGQQPRQALKASFHTLPSLPLTVIFPLSSMNSGSLGEGVPNVPALPEHSSHLFSALWPEFLQLLLATTKRSCSDQSIDLWL